MDSNDLVQIIINLGQSLGSVQNLLRGLSYLLGFLFVIKALTSFYKIGNMQHSAHHSAESLGKPMMYLVGGAVLIFVPSAITVASNTLFGATNPLQYASTNPITMQGAIMLLIQTAGLIWFLRGCVLLMTERHPSEKKGPKGLIFVCSGVLAMNIQATAAVVSTLMGYFATLSISVKNALGY